MGEVKRRLEVLSFYDCTGIVRHLEKMAQKGWALENISNFTWRYRKIQPKKLRYAVVYLPSSSEFDPGPTEANRELQEFCARAGWVQVASLAQMHIFCSEDPNPVPIETEPGMQIEIIHRAMKKNFLPSQLAMMAIGLLQLGMSVWRFFLHPLDFLCDSSNYMILLCWGLIFAMSGYDIARYYAWHKKALAAAADGVFLPTKGSQIFQYICLALIVMGFLPWIISLTSGMQRFIILFSMVFMVGLYATVWGIKGFLKRRGAKTSATRTAVWVASFVLSFAFMGCIAFLGVQGIQNDWFEEDVETYEYRNMTWEVHHDELPLYISDLTDTDYTGYSTELTVSPSPLLTRQSASQGPRMDSLDQPSLDYNIYDAHFGILTGLVRKELMNQYFRYADPNVPEEFRPVEVSMDNVEVYRLYRGGEGWNTYLAYRGSRCVTISSGWELTQEQLEIAVEILME